MTRRHGIRVVLFSEVDRIAVADPAAFPGDVLKRRITTPGGSVDTYDRVVDVICAAREQRSLIVWSAGLGEGGRFRVLVSRDWGAARGSREVTGRIRVTRNELYVDNWSYVVMSATEGQQDLVPVRRISIPSGEYEYRLVQGASDDDDVTRGANRDRSSRQKFSSASFVMELRQVHAKSSEVTVTGGIHWSDEPLY